MTALSVLIVNRDTPALTARAVWSVRDGLLRHTAECIVADDSDTPSAACPADICLATGNRGFAAACNEAAKRASGKWLLLLRPEILLTQGVLDDALDFAERDGADILGVRTYLTDGLFDRDCMRGFPTPFAAACSLMKLDALFLRSRRIGAYRQTFCDNAATQQTPCVSDAFLLIRRSLYERLSGMDEAYVQYGADADLCFRAGAQGARTVYYADRHVLREKGSRPADRAARCAAVCLFYDRHYKGAYPFFVTWAVHGVLRLCRGKGVIK